MGVELSGAACDDARFNAAQQGLDFEVWQGRTEDAMPEILAKYIGEDFVVVLDPPRVGLQPSVAKALRREPRVRRVVLVSCNPRGKFHRADFVVKGGGLRNTARILCKPGGATLPFELRRAGQIDMFAHTAHIECVLCFDRVDVPFAKPAPPPLGVGDPFSDLASGGETDSE